MECLKVNKKFSLIVLLFFTSLLFSGCLNAGKNNNETNSFNITISKGQETFFDSNKASLTFLRVVEDSRCAIDVKCVWQGQPTIELKLKKLDKNEEAIFNISLYGDERQKEVLGYLITFVDLKPDKISDKELDEKEYVATFNIEHKKS